MLIALLSLSRSLATKCMSLYNKPCMTTPTLIDLNLVEFNYFPSMISLEKSNESCNAVGDKSTKVYVASETKDTNIKEFNMITRINEAKTFTKHISCDCKCKFNNTTCNWSQKRNNNKYQCDCKCIVPVKEIIVGILTHVLLRTVGI